MPDIDSRLRHRPEYQRLLARVLEESAVFEKGLTPSQLHQWLCLEEVLLDYGGFLQQEYFRAGLELGASRATRGRIPAQGRAPGATPSLAASALAQGLAVATRIRARLRTLFRRD